MSQFTLSGNQTSFSLPISITEYELLKRFVWPTEDLEGKDMPLSATNHTRVTLDVNAENGYSIDCILRFPKETTVQEAYDQTLVKWNELKQWVNDRLEPFWDKREQWENALKNTINALGLAERFEEEAG
jgi:hypothetical protein